MIYVVRSRSKQQATSNKYCHGCLLLIACFYYYFTISTITITISIAYELAFSVAFDKMSSMIANFSSEVLAISKASWSSGSPGSIFAGTVMHNNFALLKIVIGLIFHKIWLCYYKIFVYYYITVLLIIVFPFIDIFLQVQVQVQVQQL